MAKNINIINEKEKITTVGELVPGCWYKFRGRIFLVTDIEYKKPETILLDENKELTDEDMKYVIDPVSGKVFTVKCSAKVAHIVPTLSIGNGVIA